MQASDRRYFATLSGTELAAALCERVDRFQKHATVSGFFALWLKSYQMYYGMGRDGYTSHELGRKGAQDEYVVLRINHFRNLMTHFLTLATSQRAALEPQAVTTDYRAEIETAIAKGVLDYYMRQALEQNITDATEFAVVLGAGYVEQRWNPLIGEEVLPEGIEEPAAEPPPAVPPEEEDFMPPPAPAQKGPPPALLTGNMQSFAFTPMDYGFDPTSKRAHTDWCYTRRYVNRWDLIAQYSGEDEEPVRRALMDVTAGQRERELSFEYAHLQSLAYDVSAESDEIAVYEFWHRKTPAVPAGRHAVFINEELLLYAEDLPYHDIPIQRLTCANIIGSAHGYTHAWDLLAPQEALDILKSIEMTSQRAHGAGLIGVPKGSDITPTEVAIGLNMIEFVPSLGPPVGINLTSTPDALKSNQGSLVEDMQSVSAINAVVRGQPEASLKSGSALALVQAQAVQFAQFFIGARVKFIEKLGDDCILVFQRYATEPLRLEVTGLDNSLMSESYSNADIALVRRVKVDMGNPLAHTIAGRVQLAQELVKNQMVTDPIQFLRVIETGRLEPLTEGSSRQRALVKSENEMLARARFKTDPATGETMKRPKLDPETGAPILRPGPGGMQIPVEEEVLDEEALPVALITDDHFIHAPEHLTVLASPWARRNRAVVDATLSHVKSHEDLHAFATINRPGLLQLLGIPPQEAALAQLQAQANMLAAQAQAPAGAPMKGGGGQAPRPAGAGETIGDLSPPGAQNLPKMPQLPMNTATGVRPEAPGPGGGAA